MRVLDFYRDMWAVRGQVAGRLPAWMVWFGYIIGPAISLPSKWLMSPPFLPGLLTTETVEFTLRPVAAGPIDAALYGEFCGVWYDGGCVLPPGLRDVRATFAAARDRSVWFETGVVRVGPIPLPVPLAFASYDPERAPDAFAVTLGPFHPHALFGHALVTFGDDHANIAITFHALRPFVPVLRWTVQNMMREYEASLQANWGAWVASRATSEP